MPASLRQHRAYAWQDCDHHALSSSYLELLLRHDAETAVVLLLNAVHDGLPLKELYLKVLQPTQYELGKLWQLGNISIAEEHYCTAATQQVMSRLYPKIFSTPRNGKTLVAACASSELHEVGLRMVADLFELDGWDTHFFSAVTPHCQVIQALSDTRADLLALSATMASNVGDVHKLIQAVHAAGLPTAVKIMVGGFPFNAEPDLWRRVGADGSAVGAEEAVQKGWELCTTR